MREGFQRESVVVPALRPAPDDSFTDQHDTWIRFPRVLLRQLIIRSFSDNETADGSIAKDGGFCWQNLSSRPEKGFADLGRSS